MPNRNPLSRRPPLEAEMRDAIPARIDREAKDTVTNRRVFWAGIAMAIIGGAGMLYMRSPFLFPIFFMGTMGAAITGYNLRKAAAAEVTARNRSPSGVPRIPASGAKPLPGPDVH